MIDTVPAAVTLSEPVVPQKWKIMRYDYELEPDGTLSIVGNIRVRNSQISHHFSIRELISLSISVTLG